MLRPGRRVASTFLLVLLALGALLIAPASPAAAAPVQIQLLTINDFHGRLQEDATAGVPGVARLATLVDTVSTEAPTGFAAAGDLIGASPFVSAVAQDQPTIDVLNAMGLDVSAVGNHEFDRGFADLVDRVIGDPPNAAFPHLGANVYDEESGTRALEPYVVQDVGGVDVGYVGVVTLETPSLVSPAGIEGLEFRDPVAEAEAVAAQLKDGNDANGEADVVVVLAHEGAGVDNIDSVADLQADPVFGEFVAMSDDVDAIFSGHTHQPYAFEVPIPGTTRTRPVISAQEYGKKLGRTKLTVDPDTGSVTVDVVELLDPASSAEDPDVKAIVDAAVAESAELGAVQVGSIDGDILRGGTPPGADRGVESDLGNFIADALLHGSAPENRGDADIAFMNPGGMRADFLHAASPTTPGDGVGVVTYGEAFTVQPFANDVVTKTYTGAQIKTALEQQWQPAGASRPVLWLGQSSGFTYTYNPAAPRGYRVNEGSMMLNGVPMEMDAEYRVTVNSFLAAGGDNFFVLGEGTDQFTTGNNDLVFLVDYFESFSGPADVDREPRSEVAVPEEPDLTPFDAVADAVTQMFTDIAGRQPTADEAYGWQVGIYTGTRTIEQMVLELHNVELRTPEAQLTRIYIGLFGRPPDLAGLDYWVAQMAAGRSINSVAAFFARSAEFEALYGDATDEEFVDLVYENLLGRAPDAEGRAYWLGELARGVPRHRVFLLFSESPENRNATAPALKAIDLVVAMLGRPLTASELEVVTDALRSGEATFTNLIYEIRHSEEYAERVGS